MHNTIPNLSKLASRGIHGLLARYDIMQYDYIVMDRISLTGTDENLNAIDRAVKVLRAGGVIVYPTDTVYGIGADATNSIAVERVRAIKGGEDTKPILAMVAGMTMLEEYAVMTPLARALTEHFLPGPLTLVLDTRSDALAPIATHDGSVGFRMPDDHVCIAITTVLGRPVTSTSVNRSGVPQPQELSDMLVQIAHKSKGVDLVLDKGTLPLRAPSTIVDARGASPVFLRIGAIEESVILGIFSD